jgi:hypothetical protein
MSGFTLLYHKHVHSHDFVWLSLVACTVLLYNRIYAEGWKLCANHGPVPSGYLFVMPWHSDFSDDSSCLQYFWNLGSGTSATLVYNEIHRLCFRTALNFTDTTLAKRELAVNTLRKLKSVKTTLSNTLSFKLLNPIKTCCSWLISKTI